MRILESGEQGCNLLTGYLPEQNTYWFLLRLYGPLHSGITTYYFVGFEGAATVWVPFVIPTQHLEACVTQ